jgi:hypothetical protein
MANISESNRYRLVISQVLFHRANVPILAMEHETAGPLAPSGSETPEKWRKPEGAIAIIRRNAKRG